MNQKGKSKMTYKDLKNKIKEEQKTLAHKIRICKPLRKPCNWEAADEETRKLCRWENYSSNFRHRHIIYCHMFNNTPYDKIETTVRDNNRPNGYLLDKIRKEWEDELDEALRDCA
jgi:hypothetical protein